MIITMQTTLVAFSTLVMTFIVGTSLSCLGVIQVEPWFHVMLEAGIYPLSIAAICFFASVLGRSPVDTRQLTVLTGIMFLGGALMLATSFHMFSDRLVLIPAALIFAALWHLDKWIIGVESTGAHHPSLDWYLSSLICFGAGLIAVALVPFLPGWQVQLRTFNRLISLYGFLGISGVGTLQFLMPVVTNRLDLSLDRRLRTGLPWVFSGALILALDGLLQHWGYVLGVALLSWPLAKGVFAWCFQYRREIFALHGIAPTLWVTVLGFFASLICMLIAPESSARSLNIFMYGFVFPLIVGVASYLLPVWKEARHRPTTVYINNHRLNHWSGVRASLFLLAAITPFWGFEYSAMFGVAGLTWFEIALVKWTCSDDGRRHKIKRVDIAR